MHGSHYELEFEGETLEIEVERCDEASISFRADGHYENARFAIQSNDLYLGYGGRTDHFTDRSYAPPATESAFGDGVLKAPMVGLIVRVNVEPGAEATKGDVLVVLEAMKMENQVVAPYDGTVESVNVSVGDQVDANQVLLTIASRKSEDE